MLLVVALICSSCSLSLRPIYIDEEKKTAEIAVEKLHSRMNAEQYEAIYDDAHEQLKRTGQRQAIINTMKTTRDRMGKILAVTDHWIDYVKGDPIPVRAVYNIKCENGDFSELIAYGMGTHGEALLAHYQNYAGSAPRPKD